MIEPAPLEREVHAFLAIYKKVFGTAPDMIVECGARDCTETTLFSQLCPASRIYTFECNPFTLPTCRDRTAKLPNVELIEKAVTDHDGTVTFYPTDPKLTQSSLKDGNPGASSLLKVSANYPHEKVVQNEVTVAATRLDTFLAAKGVPSIDAMWMDIQGAEVMALRGLGSDLKNVRLIHLEVEFVEMYEGQPLFKDVKKFLNEQGFKLFGFTRFFGFDGDAVFINKIKVSQAMKLQLLVSNALAYYYQTLYKANRPLQRVLDVIRMPVRRIKRFFRGSS